MRPIELIPETIDVTNNGPESLRLPFGVTIAPGATATVALYKYTGGPASGAGENTGGTSIDPAKLDPQTPVGTVVGGSDPGPTAGIPAGPGAPRAGNTGGTPSSANTGPVHIHGDSPRQRLWNAIVAAVQDNLASGKFLSAAVLAAAGTGQAVGDVLTVVGGTATVPATATVTHTQLVGVAIADGGSGYTAGDVLTVPDGTGTHATIHVDTVAAITGVITGASVLAAGDYTANPALTSAPTGGTGTLASITLTMGAKVVALTNQGNYSVAPASPAATTSSGSGVGATLTLTFVTKLVTLANQVVGSGQPNIAVGNAGGYFGADLDYQTPWQKRTQAVDTGVRTVGGTVGFNAAPKGGAAVVGIIPR
ncbi:MAG: hypothetical protein WC869_00360 [Phycisphaerae bacterium]|jgi:hypothetical protein